MQHCVKKGLIVFPKPLTPSSNLGRGYKNEYLVSLPWSQKTEDNLDLDSAARILDGRHHGLHKVKERILEHLAVKILVTNRKPRILVVDDEEIARKNLEHILRKENYTVVTVEDGLEAVKKIEASDYDVILTDIRMEKVNGLEVLAKVKR